MSDFVEAFLAEQRVEPGKTWRGHGAWTGRDTLVRRYADALSKAGLPATFDAIREMLSATGRGYSLAPDQISRALASRYARKAIPKQPNGRPVVVEGERFRSALAAAERHGVARQTVLNRINSPRPQWAGWRMAD